jgi:hypothetical protein
VDVNGDMPLDDVTASIVRVIDHNAESAVGSN